MKYFIQFCLLLAILRFSRSTAPHIWGRDIDLWLFQFSHLTLACTPTRTSIFPTSVCFIKVFETLRTSVPPVFKSHAALIIFAEIYNTIPTPSLIHQKKIPNQTTSKKTTPLCRNLKEFYVALECRGVSTCDFQLCT